MAALKRRIEVSNREELCQDDSEGRSLSKSTKPAQPSTTNKAGGAFLKNRQEFLGTATSITKLISYGQNQSNESHHHKNTHCDIHAVATKAATAIKILEQNNDALYIEKERFKRKYEEQIIEYKRLSQQISDISSHKEQIENIFAIIKAHNDQLQSSIATREKEVEIYREELQRLSNEACVNRSDITSSTGARAYTASFIIGQQERQLQQLSAQIEQSKKKGMEDAHLESKLCQSHRKISELSAAIHKQHIHCMEREQSRQMQMEALSHQMDLKANAMMHEYTEQEIKYRDVIIQQEETIRMLESQVKDLEIERASLLESESVILLNNSRFKPRRDAYRGEEDSVSRRRGSCSEEVSGLYSPQIIPCDASFSAQRMLDLERSITDPSCNSIPCLNSELKAATQGDAQDVMVACLGGLCGAGCINIFQENRMETMEEIQELMGYRWKIDRKIKAYLNSKPVMVDAGADDEKNNCMNNTLVVCVGIARYNAKVIDDLNTANDIAMYRAVFEYKYNYTLIANDPKQPMNRQQLDAFLYKARNELYDFKQRKMNYDSLIVAFGGHGTHDSVLCSDGGKFKHKDARSIFCIPDLRDIPKIFLIDACRTDDDSEMKTAKARGAFTASTFSSTLMTAEGHQVYGAKICKYITQIMADIYEKGEYGMTFREVYMEAKRLIKVATDEEQDLILCEHDTEIDKIVFVPNDKDKVRGTKYKRHRNDMRQTTISRSHN